MREAYEVREIDEVLWVPSGENPADAFTKEEPSPALIQLMTSNKMKFNPLAWVERKKNGKARSMKGMQTIPVFWEKGECRIIQDLASRSRDRRKLSLQSD